MKTASMTPETPMNMTTPNGHGLLPPPPPPFPLTLNLLPFLSLRAFALLALALLLGLAGAAHATGPDLTVGTNRYGVNRTYTYNLGPTGMRGWIRTTPRYDSDLDTAETP